jgi:hypothetical protein
MKSGVITAARLLNESVRAGGFRGNWMMVTLTYRDGVTWIPRHIVGLVQAMRKYFQRRGAELRYTWVLELTKRGRPHYHLLVWRPRGLHLPHADTRGWWPHGMTKTERARNAVGYIAKYTSKGHIDENLKMPKGSRISACGGLEPEAKIERRWWLTPRYVREAWPTICDVMRVLGGWCRRDNGEFTATPWTVEFREGVIWCRRKSWA